VAEYEVNQLTIMAQATDSANPDSDVAFTSAVREQITTQRAIYQICLVFFQACCYLHSWFIRLLFDWCDWRVNVNQIHLTVVSVS
jgi:hypothetical protein